MKRIIELIVILAMAIGMFSCGDTAEAENAIPVKTEDLKDVQTVPIETTDKSTDEAVAEAIEKESDEKTTEDSAATTAEKTKEPAKVKTAPKKVKKKPAKKNPNAPKIVFEEMSYNFGTVNEGELITHKFFFQNKGKENLLIKNATATCGCTVPGFSKVPIEPEESSYVRISFNTKAKKGPQKPVVTVFTNARKTPYKLYFEGNVIPAPDEEGEKENEIEGGE